MNELAQLHCSRVTANTPRLSPRELRLFLAEMPGWETHQKKGALRLERSFKFPDFHQALMFANRVGELADEENHHPLLMTEWGKVTVIWWTHVHKGLSKNDFIMAAKTELLA